MLLPKKKKTKCMNLRKLNAWTTVKRSDNALMLAADSGKKRFGEKAIHLYMKEGE